MPFRDNNLCISRLFLAAVTDATELWGNPTASATTVTSSTPITASIRCCRWSSATVCARLVNVEY
ncbi:MAG TPA: hypothetical protein PKK23_14885 [Nitrospirales bacterium]|nr:hypothetical protein [Nitrospirales bacterium]